jgi:all-trans-retinol 13,14-reductase
MVFVGLNGSGVDLNLDLQNHHFMAEGDFVAKLEEYSRLSNEQLLDTEPPFLSVTFPSMKDSTYERRFPGG